jgi:predicted transport protein
MPQNENISAEWQRSLGAEWKQIHAKWLHTLGNLTLTGYNSSYSDHAFIYKRDMSHDPVKSLRNSPLRLNQGLGQLDTWNEQTIQARAQRLADIGLKVWFAPSISEQLILTYTKKRVRQEYTLEQYPSLMSNKLRPLYDEFRRAVLDLDSMMTEEFLKHYIAYKAETNVVDLIPLTKTIKVVLNIRFSEINDPHGKCRDISNIGSLGNGEVELIFDQIQDIPYIIGLVRQVVEHQLGAEE